MVVIRSSSGGAADMFFVILCSFYLIKVYSDPKLCLNGFKL